MKRILSKSLLISVILLIPFSGCAKRAIPDTIAEVEQSWFAFEQQNITYDELKEKIAGYYVEFDHTVGDRVFLPGFQGSEDLLYKDLEGMTWDEFFVDKMGADEDWREQVQEAGLSLESSQVSVSTSVDAVLDQQMAFAWREDVVKESVRGDVCRILSSRYLFSKVDGEWKIALVQPRWGVYYLTDTDEEKALQRDVAAMHDYQDEAEYVQTITLK